VKRAKPLACIVGLLLSVATFARQPADSFRRPGLASFAHYYGGLMKSEEGDFNGAIAEFNRLIELNPKDAIPYYNRGLLEANKRDFDRAIADFNRAIQLRPKFARAFNDRGSIKVAMREIDGATADFSRAIQLSPQFVQAYMNLGSVMAYRGDLDEAIANFNQAVQLDPDSVEAFENLGSAKATKGDLEGAIADYDQAIQLDPQNFEAFEKRALTRQLKGDFERALSDLIHCDELAPPGDQGSGNSRALATDSGQRPLDESEYNRRMGAKRWCIGTSGVCSHQGSGSPRQFILPSFQITQVAELTPAAWAARNLPPRMHPTGVNRIFGKTLLFFRHSRVNC